MFLVKTILACIVVTLVLAACAPVPAPAPARQPVTLTVSAASDLTPAFTEIGAAFEQQTGDKVAFNFGSTGQLGQQIAKGADVDVFAAASVSAVDDLDRQGLVLAGTRKIYARGALVMWTRPDSPLHLAAIQDLAGPGVTHVAIANPDHAPYGVAAREALQSAGLWDSLQPRLVMGENVSQAFQYAQSGNVDAALLPLSLVIQGSGRYVPVPENLYKPIDQALAVIKTTRAPDAARAFEGFVAGTQGQQVLKKYGFTVPGG